MAPVHENGKVKQAVVIAAKHDPITVAEAAALTGRSYRTVQRWVDAGRLAVIGRITKTPGPGGKILLDREEVEELAKDPPKHGPSPDQSHAIM